jgi:Tfp pilus assembly protein PilO
MKTLFSTILLIGALGIFFGYTQGKYNIIKETKLEIASLQSDFEKSKVIISKRDELKKVYSSFKADDLKDLDSLIPDNVDNIRLIMDMNSIAKRYGLVLKGITINEDSKDKDAIDQEVKTALDSIEVAFKVSSTYENFVQFLRDLERSLRIVDVTSLSFKSTDVGVYDFSVSIKTYWLSK